MASTSSARATTTSAGNAIDFVVVSQDDLFLEGGVRKLFRVAKGLSYPCQMQKNQTFSCLFRHYAKHNGLRKEDLIFYFTDELEQEGTPESIHLMPQDEIWVSHKKCKGEEAEDTDPATDNFTVDLRSILQDDTHSDITFLVGPNQDVVLGHKAILSARSEYFEAMFRKEGLCESSSNTVRISDHDVTAFRKAMEFIYTNCVQAIEELDTDTIINILTIANEYILDDLKKLCCQSATKLLTCDNVGRFMSLCSHYSLESLRASCVDFVRSHHNELKTNATFCSSIEQSPELGLLLLDALNNNGIEMESDMICSDVNGKRKRARIFLDDSNGRTHEIPTQAANSHMIQNASYGSDS